MDPECKAVIIAELFDRTCIARDDVGFATSILDAHEWDLEDATAAYFDGWIADSSDDEGGLPPTSDAVERLGPDFVYIDNEGRGQCLFAAVRDAFLVDGRHGLEPPFLLGRTASGRRTLHSLVQSLREAVAELATEQDMEAAVELYLCCMAERDRATARLATADDPESKAAARREVAEAVGLCTNFAHAAPAAALSHNGASREAQLAAFRKKLSTRTYGDAASMPRIETATGVRVIVVRGGDASVVVHEAGPTAHLAEYAVVVEHVAYGDDTGHYVLVAQCLDDDNTLSELAEPLTDGAGSKQGAQRLAALDRAAAEGNVRALFRSGELPLGLDFVRHIADQEHRQ